MKKYLILSLALAALGLTACMNSGDNSLTGQTSADAGQLQLVAMKGLSKVSTALRTTDTSSTYVFNLDTANSSLQQYFLLQNVGSHDVKHVKLTTNNSHFYFVPSEIDLLPPSKTSTLQQLVKLCIVHGTKINGVGPDSLLPMGVNIAIAQLTGTTSDIHHDSIPISQSADLKVYAKVFDVDFITFDTLPVDMTQNNFNYGPYGGISTDGLHGYSTGIYVSQSVRISAPSLKIVNSGNASFKVTVYLNNANYKAVAADSAEVPAGESYIWPYPNPAGAPLIMIDGHGVVPNGSKYWLQPAVNAPTSGKFVGIFYPSA